MFSAFIQFCYKYCSLFLFNFNFSLVFYVRQCSVGFKQYGKNYGKYCEFYLHIQNLVNPTWDMS